MGENHHQATTSSRLGIRSAGGEIVEVQGGHIVRSTGRKDRHSKVCTAKGPRDRRVRLSANTAIQFYDVQDRLGYDRPSKAVDWLIKKAKPAIDELAELPAWNPTTGMATIATAKASAQRQQQEQVSDDRECQFPLENLAASDSGRRTTTAAATTTMVGSDVQNLHQMGENPNNNSSFLPPSLDSDAIADTIKSFFPMGAAAETPSLSLQFQNYPQDLLSRTSSQNQDLRLSLHSFREPILLHPQAHHHHGQAHQNEQPVLFSGTTHLGFDGSSAGWTEHHHHSAEVNRFQRMMAWSAGTDAAGGGSGSGASVGGFIFNSLAQPTGAPPPPPAQPLFGQNQLFFQRGPLQSSNTPSIRAWIDAGMAADHQQHHHQQIPQTLHQSSLSGIGFATSGGFSGFHIPARIQGEDEEHDGITNKPSSASSDSRH